MLGKLIAHAATRAQAIEALVQALGQTEVLGLPTNRAFLAECLAHPQFCAGQAPISFLAAEADALRGALLKKELLAHDQYGLAAVLTQNLVDRGLPCVFPRPVRLRHRDATTALAVQALGAGRWRVEPGASGGAAAAPRQLQFTVVADGAVQCVQDGVAQRVQYVRAAAAGAPCWHLQAGAVDWWLEDASLLPALRAGAGTGATELRAPFNGRVVQVAAVVGQLLAAGETAVVIESMKLEHSLAGTAAASVAEVLVSAGQQVAPGQVLVRFAAPAQAAALSEANP